MGLFKKILIGTGIAGAITGIVYARRLKTASVKLVVIPRVRVHKITAQGIVLAVETKIKNPTRTPFSIKYPFVRLRYKGSDIGTSQPKDKDVLIPAYGEPDPPLQPFMIEIPLLGAFSLAWDLLQSFQTGTGIELEVITSTTVDLGLIKKNYEDTQKFTLKKVQTA